MKKIIILLTVALATVAGAQTSNLLSYVNTGSGANTGTGDPLRTSFTKINGNFTLLSSIIDSNAASGGGGITNFSFTATNRPAGTTPTVVVTGVTNNIAYVVMGIPNGAPGTNTVTNTITAYAFSNQFLSSRQIVTYSTNNITFGTSNFLARVNGLYDWSVTYGQLGGGGLSPRTNVYGQLNASFSGTNGWFILTNGFTTTNMISVAATGAGGGLGNATLFAVDHPELLSRTNSFFGQYVRFDSPRDSADAATKAYVDFSVANVKDGNFSSYTDTNNISHFIFSRNNFTVCDIANSISFIPISSLSVDGTGTNVALAIVQTNLANGYVIQSSTNLLLTAGFTTFTNYTLSTNSGVVTFTIPINFSENMRFWRAFSSSSTTATYFVPLTLAAGSLYPSNTWSLASITNQMPNFSFWTGNSNGQALVTLSLSNGVVRYLQSLR